MTIVSTLLLSVIALTCLSTAKLIRARIHCDEAFNFFYGSFSYITGNSCWKCVHEFTFNLPAGSNQIWIRAYSISGNKGFAANFKTENGTYILKTQSNGLWSATRNLTTTPAVPITLACSNSVQTLMNSSTTQPFPNDAGFPEWIWIDGQCSRSMTDYVWFTTTITVAHDDMPPNARVVTATVHTDNNFEFRQGSYFLSNYPVTIVKIVQTFQFYAQVGSNQLDFFVTDYGGSKGLLATFAIEDEMVFYSDLQTWSVSKTDPALGQAQFEPVTLSCPKRTDTTLIFPLESQYIWVDVCSSGVGMSAWFRANLVIPHIDSTTRSISSAKSTRQFTTQIKSSSGSVRKATTLKINSSSFTLEGSSSDFSSETTITTIDSAARDVSSQISTLTEASESETTTRQSTGQVSYGNVSSQERAEARITLASLIRSGPLFWVALACFLTLLFLVIGYVITTTSSKNINFNGRKSANTILITDSSINSSRTTAIHTGSTGSTSFNATNTFMPTDMGVSIPAFLRVEFGLDFREMKQLAVGGFGIVSLAQTLTSNLKTFDSLVVVKRITNLSVLNSQLNSFYQELSIMYYLKDHRNIAKMIAYSDSPYCIVMKYYKLGSLDQWLLPRNSIKTKFLIWSFSLDIATGVQVLHHKGFSHSDLKPNNVLLDEDPKSGRLFCVLADFGISQILDDKSLHVEAFQVMNIRALSTAYAAPDLISRFKTRGSDMVKADVVVADDVYSLAIMFFALITRVRPWQRNQ